MSIYKKLQEARVMLHNTKLDKSGKNKFANFNYFELSDFIPQVTNIFNNVGLCGVISFTHDTGYLTIHETEGDGFVTFTTPLVYASVEKTQPIQNLGSTHTYLRRYLWLMAMEIVENDGIDFLEQIEPPKKLLEPTPSVPNIPAPKAAVEKAAVTKTGKTAGKPGDWQLTVLETEDVNAWMESFKAGGEVLLALATHPDDVANIFKNNRVVFDKAKELDEKAYAQIMVSFSETRKSLTKE